MDENPYKAPESPLSIRSVSIWRRVLAGLLLAVAAISAFWAFIFLFNPMKELSESLRASFLLLMLTLALIWEAVSIYRGTRFRARAKSKTTQN